MRRLGRDRTLGGAAPPDGLSFLRSQPRARACVCVLQIRVGWRTYGRRLLLLAPPNFFFSSSFSGGSGRRRSDAYSDSRAVGERGRGRKPWRTSRVFSVCSLLLLPVAIRHAVNAGELRSLSTIETRKRERGVKSGSTTRRISGEHETREPFDCVPCGPCCTSRLSLRRGDERLQ